MEAEKRAKVSAAVRDLLATWISEGLVETAGDVNMGPCAVFADELIEALTEEGVDATFRDTVDLLAERGLENGDYHAWVMVDDVAFDAGCPEGCMETLLTTNIRILRGASAVDPDAPLDDGEFEEEPAPAMAL